MRQLGQKLAKEYIVDVKFLAMDLSQPESAKIILRESEEVDAGLLVYNAAFSFIKPFIDQTPKELDTFLEVNIRTQIHLLHAFVNRLINRKRKGGVLVMSSLSGLLGMQFVATYAATKAFAWNLAESLHHELSPHNIDIMACLAGVTNTPAFRRSKPKFGFPKPKVMQPEVVAEGALNALGKKTLYIPGFSNRFSYFILTRLIPRKMASSIANKTMRKMYGHH